MAAITGPFSEYQVRLYRDGLSTPWGFRLQGGKDFKIPLTIQRVFVGSPAEGELHRGDIIVAIENHDATSLLHKQAQDMFKSSGGSLSLRVKRGTVIAPRAKTPPPSFPQSFRSRPVLEARPPGPSPATFAPQPAATASLPHVPTFGVDYSKAHQHHPPPKQRTGPVMRPIPVSPGIQSPKQAQDDFMMHQIQRSLDDVIWQPRSDEAETPYEAKPVKELKQQFMKTNPPAKPVQVKRFPHGPQKPAWSKPRDISPPSSLTEPGWCPKGYSKQWQPVSPSRTAPPPVQPQQHFKSTPRPGPPPQQPASGGAPAWSGSLRSASGSKPWEGSAAPAAEPAKHVQFQQNPSAHAQVHTPRHQNVHYAPGQAPQYQQLPAQSQQQGDARVVHLQYNSPMGLYSKNTAEEVLQGQTSGQPGQGTLQVDGQAKKKKVPTATLR